MIPLWKMNLRPASFNGAGFHVDVNTKAGGRRNALHEYPKRDMPYAEDMGRKARRFSVTAYVIGSNYTTDRDALIDELEKEGPGALILPTGMVRAGESKVNIDQYSVSERRERGGIATFEIAFIEAGINTNSITNTDTQGAVNGEVDNGVGGTAGVAGTVAGDGGVMGTANSFSAFAGSSDFNGWT